MKTRKLASVFALLLALSMVVGLCSCGANNKKEFPSEDIEFVIPYSAGGATDILNRYTLDVISKTGLSDATFYITNKPGGSTSVGHKYVVSEAGNDHMLLGTASSLVTGALMNSEVPGYDAFTPIALIGAECGMWCVGADSPIQTLDDLIALAQTEKGATIAIGSLGTLDHANILKLQEMTNSTFVTVPNESDSEAMVQAMNGSADVVICNPRTVKGQIEAGELRAIGVTAPERVEGFDCPTFVEEGYEISSVTPKCVMAAPDISEEAKAYYIDLFTKLTETQEWKDYIDSINGTHLYMFGDDLHNYLKDLQDTVKPLFEAAGLI